MTATITVGLESPEAARSSASLHQIGADNALIIVQRSAVASDLARGLAREGFHVDVVAHPAAPVLHSRFCRRRIVSPGWVDFRFEALVRGVVEDGTYAAIYVCEEGILEWILPLAAGSPRWRGLVAPDIGVVKLALSKNAAAAYATSAGVPIPRTLIPEDERDVEAIARDLGLPLVVKGERGEGARNVRIVREAGDVMPRYRELRRAEERYGGRPALQEFVPGPTYLVGGLFRAGAPLRICAHRKVLMYPPGGAATAKAVTEHHPRLLESALRIFNAFGYTGLGSVDFIRDARDGEFKFLEINPRPWGSIGLCEHAGVQLYRAYSRLALGLPVEPDLRFQVGIRYQRLGLRLRAVRKRPTMAVGLLGDLLDRRVVSEFDWREALTYLLRRTSLGVWLGAGGQEVGARRGVA